MEHVVCGCVVGTITLSAVSASRVDDGHFNVVKNVSTREAGWCTARHGESPHDKRPFGFTEEILWCVCCFVNCNVESFTVKMMEHRDAFVLRLCIVSST